MDCNNNYKAEEGIGNTVLGNLNDLSLYKDLSEIGCTLSETKAEGVKEETQNVNRIRNSACSTAILDDVTVKALSSTNGNNTLHHSIVESQSLQYINNESAEHSMPFIAIKAT